MTTPASPETAEQLRAALAKEYGQYVAVQTIDLYGARAFNVGDAVPASHVDRGIVQPEQVEQVEQSSTTAAPAALENGS